MAMRLVWTRYGRDAAEALHRTVAEAKADDALAPVTVVVPSNHVGVATRRLLASGRLGPTGRGGVGIAAVSFLTPYRLAELLGAAPLAATGRRPVSTPVLAAAVRAGLAADAGLFEAVKDHPATESALVATYQELRDITPAALDSLAGTGARAAEVVRLHRATRARLEASWSDEQDLVRSAIAAVQADPSLVAELGELVVHLPQRLSLHAAELLAAVAAHAPVSVVAGATGDTAADQEVLTSLRRLGLDPADAPVDAALPVGPQRTTIVVTSDGDEEVRAAVRAVVDAAREGTRLDRIAVLHASAEPYARLTHEHLRAAGIATNGASIVPLAARLAGRTLLEMMALAEHGFRRQDVFTWLAGAPILFEGRWAPTTAWERISREAGVVSDSDWDDRLAELEAQQRERAERCRADAEAPEWMAERAERQADHAAGLRRFVTRLMSDLGRASEGERSWAEHTRWAQQHLDDLLGRAHRREAWPEVERKAAEAIEASLLRLAALDDVEPPVPLEVFRRTLQVELESDLGRTGRFGEGVLVGSVEMGVGLDLDLVVVLGLAEGSFPAPVRDDSLLPDRERAAAAGQLSLRADRVERQHRHLLATLAGASRQVLCVPRGDLRRSVERVPSRWVLDIATALAGEGRWWADDLYSADVPWVRRIGSFHDGLRRLTVPATAQEHRLLALDAAAGAFDRLGDARLTASAEVVSARRSARFTRFDGNLSDVAVESPLANTMSPTRLEVWTACPHRFLVEHLLGATPLENPEDELTITPMDRGNVIHTALERLVLESLDGRLPPVGHGEPWGQVHRDRLQVIGAEECDAAERAGLTGRPIFWRRERRRILDDLDKALAFDNAQRAVHGTRPAAAELSFGIDGAPPVTVPLPDGRTVSLRGRADRIDVAADGSIHVVDYKTGKSDGTAKLKLSEENPTASGLKLQLPVYGLAGRMHLGRPDAPVHAWYWFFDRKRGFRPIGYPVTGEVLTATAHTLSRMLSGIESGLFPPHPDGQLSSTPSQFVSCKTCDPDGLGVTDLLKAWQRKQADPAMAPYVQLVEPPEPEAEPEEQPR